MPEYFCNKCGYTGNRGPGHSGCLYQAAEIKTTRLEPMLPKECPRCGNHGVFEYKDWPAPKYGPGKFYCESCDAGHKKPMTKEEVETKERKP